MGTTEAAMVTCAQCARSFRWKPELAGRKVKCKCGGRIEFPQAEALDAGDFSAGEEEKPVGAAQGEGGGFQMGLEDDAAAYAPEAAIAPVAPVAQTTAAPARAAAQVVCPTCNNAVTPQTVLCTRCGTNLRTGAKLKTAIKGPGMDGGDVAKAAGKVVLSMVVGGAAALVGAGVWIGIILLTGFSIGIVAWAIGLGIGGVMRLVNRGGGKSSGIAGALFALVAIILPKGLIFMLLTMGNHSTDGLFQPLDVLWSFLAMSSAYRLAKGNG